MNTPSTRARFLRLASAMSRHISGEPDAIRVHGITNEMVRGKPKFSAICEEMLEFIGDKKIIAHNAQFDRGFINMELERHNRPATLAEQWIDTLEIARHRFPGMPASLDALCRRFNISLAERDLHGRHLQVHAVHVRHDQPDDHVRHRRRRLRRDARLRGPPAGRQRDRRRLRRRLERERRVRSPLRPGQALRRELRLRLRALLRRRRLLQQRVQRPVRRVRLAPRRRRRRAMHSL